MKKEYKKLVVHVKQASITEPGKCEIEQVSTWFNPKNVCSIEKYANVPDFNQTFIHKCVDKYMFDNKIEIYKLIFFGDTNGTWILENMILSEEQLNEILNAD